MTRERILVHAYAAQPIRGQDVPIVNIDIDKPCPDGAMPIDLNASSPHGTGRKCPKCAYGSGNDWRQCEGKCPLPSSPHFDAFANAREFHYQNAKRIADALVAALPGGTVDALLLVLLDHKQSQLKVLMPARDEGIPL